MNLKNILLREKIISQTRSFFESNHFQEINLPVLLKAVPKEQNIYPFHLKWQYHKDNLTLATSPETALKLLISQTTIGNCFAISSSFRDLEAKGPTHQPEFFMLEWYRLNANYRQIMDDTQNLIIEIYKNIGNNFNNRTNYKLTYQNTVYDLTPPWPKITFSDLFKNYASLPLPSTEPELNQIFLNQIEPHLKKLNQPVFITDYPAFLSPLAATTDDPAISQRFELYFGDLEIANGCTENLNPPIKTPWKNLPPSAGCGLGIDRLAILFTDSSSIEEVRPLPL